MDKVKVLACVGVIPVATWLSFGAWRSQVTSDLGHMKWLIRSSHARPKGALFFKFVSTPNLSRLCRSVSLNLLTS